MGISVIQNQISAISILLGSLILIACSLAPVSLGATEDRPSILIINGAQQGQIDAHTKVSGIIDAIRGQSLPVDLEVYYLGSLNGRSEARQALLTDLKRSLRRFRMVITTDEISAKTLFEMRDYLGDSGLIIHAEPENRAFQIERANWQENWLPISQLTAELIQQGQLLKPQARTVYLLTSSIESSYWTPAVVSALRAIMPEQWTIKVWRGVTPDQLRRWVTAMEKDAIVVITDQAGLNTINFREAAGGQSQGGIISDQPSSSDFYEFDDRLVLYLGDVKSTINRKILGGRQLHHDDHGQAIATMLAQEFVNSGGVTALVSSGELYPYVFFKERFTTQGFSTASLSPAAAMGLRNETEDYWRLLQSSWWLIFGFAISLCVSLLLIGGLFYSRHISQQRLKKQQFNNSILETSGALICVVDPKGHIIAFNKACVEVSGFDVASVLGESLAETLVVPEERAAMAAILEDVHSGLSPIDFETYWQTKSGLRRLVSWVWTGNAADDGEVRYVIGTGTDITEQQRIVSDLALTSDRMAAILNTAVEGIITIDENAIIQSANRAALEMFGYDEEELRGHNVSLLMPEPYRSRHDGFIENYTRTGDAKIIGIGREVQGLRKNGEQFPIDLGIAEWHQQGQRFFTGMIRDISDRQTAEDALRRSQKMEAVGQLTGGIAHDFNNILGVLIGNLDLIEEKINRDDPHWKLVKSAQRAVMRGSDLTRRLLAFSRQSSGPLEVVDINEIVRGMQDILDKSLNKDIEVQLKLSEDLWPVRADAGDFETAILNFALNSRDAMPDGGRFIIETENRTLPPDHKVPDLDPGDYVMVLIKDNGLGMSEEVCDQVFEPFFSTKPQSEGTGLGLSIIYGFISRAQGHISVSSALGLGTTFQVFIPRSLQPKITSPINKSVSITPALGSETVLVVDDEKDMLETCSAILETLGYSVITSSDTSDALDTLYGNQEIDLLISDVVMPGGLNGFELAMVATAQRPDLRVLMTSGFVKNIDDMERIQGLYGDILIKPYRRDALALAVRRALDTQLKSSPD